MISNFFGLILFVGVAFNSLFESPRGSASMVARRNFTETGSQFVIFKPLSNCFEETIGFDVKALFVGRPISRLIRSYNVM